MQKKQSIGQILIRFRTILILIALAVVFAILKQEFLHPTNLLNMMKRMSSTAIAAYGMTFIITLAALDISGGSIAALVGVVLAYSLNKGLPVAVALPMVIILATLLGLVNGVISVKGKIAPFLVTLSTMNIYRGIALTMTEGRTVSIKIKPLTDFFGNGTILEVVPTPIIIMAVMFLLCWFLYRKTKFGFYCRCIGGNEEAARVAGIAVDKIKIFTYTFNGFLACFAGLILAALMNAGIPSIGADLSMDAIAAVVLGGTAIAGGIGSMWGTVGGTFIMSILSTGMSLLGAGTQMQLLVKGIVIILAVLMDNALKARTTIIQD